LAALLVAVDGAPIQPAHASAADSSEYFDVVVPEVTGSKEPAAPAQTSDLIAARSPSSVESFTGTAVAEETERKKRTFTKKIPLGSEAKKLRAAVAAVEYEADTAPKIVRHPRRTMRHEMDQVLKMHSLGMRKVAQKSALTKVIQNKGEEVMTPKWLDLASRKIPEDPLEEWQKKVGEGGKTAVTIFEKIVKDQGLKLRDAIEKSAGN